VTFRIRPLTRDSASERIVSTTRVARSTPTSAVSSVEKIPEATTSRGLGVPMLVILAGAIGGMIRAGMTGFFVGPVLLAIFYRLFTEWVRQDEPGTDPAVLPGPSN